MPVSKYDNTVCRYRIGKLDKYVYLIRETDVRNSKIHIDNGEAYIEEITAVPITLPVYNLTLTDGDELDERYKFTHQLAFSVNGYANYTDFQDRYFVVLRSLDGVYWLVNPQFPVKVTYTYTLDTNSSRTDFTIGTISNFPTLRLNGFNPENSYECGYTLCTFKSLKLNESKYSFNNYQLVKYTNDGFKDINFNRGSASFTEQFNGNKVQHNLSFRIGFDEYKSSWHYNLLEFQNNLYAAIIGTTCGNYFLTGFNFGLHPSFTVEANEESSIDSILIELSDVYDNGSFVDTVSSISYEKDESSEWRYTTEHDGYECVGNYLAKYLLREEIDGLGNRTGNYQVLEGYEDDPRFSGLRITGTFSEEKTFRSSACVGNCMLQSTIPDEITFNTVSCREYTLLSDTNWIINSTQPYITVSPGEGLAGEPYTIKVCNRLEPTNNPVNSNLTISYCDTFKTHKITVSKADDCFTAGSVWDISANGQYVTVPVACCVTSAEDKSGTITNIKINTSTIRLYVPQNDTGSARKFTIAVSYCDGNTGEIIINQGTGFEKWVKEETRCNGTQKCDVERKYTGNTASDINTWTNELRYVNCAASSDCTGSIERWIDSSETTCSGGKKWTVQIQQISYDDGSTWVNTGIKKLGYEIEDTYGECTGIEEFEEWRDDDGYVCLETTKYARERLWVSVDKKTWIGTDVYRRTTKVLEENSEDCGFIVPSTGWTWEDWRVVDNLSICDDGNKYEKLRRFVSNDNVTSKDKVTNWKATDVYKKGELIEENSTDCGYDPSITGNCSEYRDDGYTICEGYDRYKYLRKYVRDCDDCNNCDTEWKQTNIYKYGDLVKGKSFDCGYIPGDTYYKWIEDGYTCDGYDKYVTYRKYISETGNEDDWYQTNIYKPSDNPSETNSEDCGYVDRLVYDYRWIETDMTGCTQYTKVYMYKKQRRKRDTDDPYEDVVPTVLSPNADGSEPVREIEQNSEDCGYVNPITPLYKWVNMDITTDWICENCGSVAPQYRTVSSAVTCVNFDKHSLNEYQVSYDDGDTWRTISTYTGSLVEPNSPDCGYVPQAEGFKLKMSNFVTQKYDPDTEEIIDIPLDQEDSYVDCNTSSVITQADVKTLASASRVVVDDRVQLFTVTIGGCVTTIGQNAFSYDYNIVELLFTSNIVKTIEREAFYGCLFKRSGGYRDIVLPEGLEIIQESAFASTQGKILLPTTLKRVEDRAFQGSSAAVSFRDLENSQLEYIGTEAFDMANQPIYLPASVKYIGKWGIRLPYQTIVYLHSTTPPELEENGEGSYEKPIVSKQMNVRVYVPESSFDAYKSSPWGEMYGSSLMTF